jgi:hypothetical protein
MAGVRIFNVHTVAGTLMAAGVLGAPGRDLPAPHKALYLVGAFSGREAGKVSTDERGSFAFAGVRPGLYAIRVQWRGEDGYALLNVSRAASNETREFLLALGDCGLAVNVLNQNAEAN